MTQVENLPSTVIKEEQPTAVIIQVATWHGRLIHVIEQVVQCIITQFFKMAAFCLSLTTANSETSEEATNGQLSKLKKATEFHQTQSAALDYMRLFKAKQTVALFKYDLNLFCEWMRQYPSDSANKQRDEFQNNVDTLADYLSHIEEEMETNPSAQEVMNDISEVLEHAKEFYPRIQAMGSALLKGSPEKKYFANIAKEFAFHYRAQEKIYQPVSSDPYLRSLQENEQVARLALKALQQQLTMES